MNSKKKLFVIVGPTAVGKTAAAVSVAEKLNTEIVSADSRQIFKELNVGTAKPSQGELERVAHHFIGNKSIQENYDAGQYGRDALDLIHSLFKKNEWLVMVGGSGLYLKAALEGFDDMPDVPDSVRLEILKDFHAKGLPWLQQQVRDADPEFFGSVDQQNPQRLMRALELLQSTDKSMSELRIKKKIEHPFEVIKVGLNLPRETLYQRIDARMDQMIRDGLFAEAKQFYSFKHLNALQTVGYREIFDYIDGLNDYEETVRLLKRNSRRYAKRQLTWFQRDSEINWFENETEILRWLKERFSIG
ncbi:MAG TPA: tRNA (adenosine(37)-N6)-dimethylallyltransferase MiaA [Cyclobacteriaceae bacterium]|nr:tRNA (adenosine(37)-N6)-dimethylallyltransferase MiaA [Cyclobacteriaceae bacterium]